MTSTVLDLLDLCEGCCHLTLAPVCSDVSLSRCKICGVPTPAGERGHGTRGHSSVGGGLAWGSTPTRPSFRDPYLSATRMHLCRGCDRIVQDERAWQARKHGSAAGTFRCRNCQLPVPAQRALPTEGPQAEDGLLLDAADQSQPAATRPHADPLIERVRAGHAGAAAQLGERHRRTRDVLESAWPTAALPPRASAGAASTFAFGRHFCAADAISVDDHPMGPGGSDASLRTPPASTSRPLSPPPLSSLPPAASPTLESSADAATARASTKVAAAVAAATVAEAQLAEARAATAAALMRAEHEVVEAEQVALTIAQLAVEGASGRESDHEGVQLKSRAEAVLSKGVGAPTYLAVSTHARTRLSTADRRIPAERLAHPATDAAAVLASSTDAVQEVERKYVDQQLAEIAREEEKLRAEEAELEAMLRCEEEAAALQREEEAAALQREEEAAELQREEEAAALQREEEAARQMRKEAMARLQREEEVVTRQRREEEVAKRQREEKEVEEEASRQSVAADEAELAALEREERELLVVLAKQDQHERITAQAAEAVEEEVRADDVSASTTEADGEAMMRMRMTPTDAPLPPHAAESRLTTKSKATLTPTRGVKEPLRRERLDSPQPTRGRVMWGDQAAARASPHRFCAGAAPTTVEGDRRQARERDVPREEPSVSVTQPQQEWQLQQHLERRQDSPTERRESTASRVDEVVQVIADVDGTVDETIARSGRHTRHRGNGMVPKAPMKTTTADDPTRVVEDGGSSNHVRGSQVLVPELTPRRAAQALAAECRNWCAKDDHLSAALKPRGTDAGGRGGRQVDANTSVGTAMRPAHMAHIGAPKTEQGGRRTHTLPRSMYLVGPPEAVEYAIDPPISRGVTHLRAGAGARSRIPSDLIADPEAYFRVVYTHFPDASRPTVV
jgi:hypothetical protein